MITDAQVKKLLKYLSQGISLEVAAARSGMDEKTGRKYRKLNKLPRDIKAERGRNWRTRCDPLGDLWGTARSFLEINKGLEAKTLFTYLQRENPGRISGCQLRTFQRRVKSWRATANAHQEVFFPKGHEPGKMSRASFRDLSSLQVRIAGQPFDHQVYLFVLAYSNWETGFVFLADDFQSLSEGLQKSLLVVGGVPEYHRTDGLGETANKAEDPAGIIRGYQDLLEHYRLAEHPLDRWNPDEKQAAENRYRCFEKALDQSLILRGSRDFSDLIDYEGFLRKLFEQLNQSRLSRLREEQKVLRRLPGKNGEMKNEAPRWRRHATKATR